MKTTNKHRNKGGKEGEWRGKGGGMEGEWRGEKGGTKGGITGNKGQERLQIRNKGA